MEAMKEKMKQREQNKLEVFNLIRDAINVETSSHVGYMKAVSQSVLDGTSKWSAKLTITGFYLFFHFLFDNILCNCFFSLKLNVLKVL
jgi:hypothetical protein